MPQYRYHTLANLSEEMRVAVLQPCEFDHDIYVAFETCLLNVGALFLDRGSSLKARA